MNTAIASAKRTAQAIARKRLHTKHKQQALKALSNTEKDNGKTTKQTANKCREYAIEVLGGKEYLPWLLVYANVRGGFREGWIPDNFYGEKVVPKINGWYGKASGRKPLTTAMLGRGEELPELAYYVNGVFLDAEYRVVPREKLKDLIFSQSRRAVFKTVSYGQGLGVHFFERDTFDPDQIPPLGHGVFQSCIAQHDSLERFSPGSVATLRLTTTVEDDGAIACRGAYLRLGRSEETHVQSASHIRVPLDLGTGVLQGPGYLANWRQTAEHPDSGIAFEGFEMPAFQHCLGTAKKFHARVPYVRAIGWDLAVDKDGKAKVMEWNGGHNDIKFSEAVQGPCFFGLGWERLGDGPQASRASEAIRQVMPDASYGQADAAGGVSTSSGV